MDVKRVIKNRILATWSLAGAAQAKQLAGTYGLPGDYERIYFWHIRKTAGTSLNRAFIALGGEEPIETHRRMLRSLNKRTVSGGKVYVAHNRYLIQQGRYFYAFSHHPWHEITLPPRTFMITCFRDPVKRVVSHYRMLVGLEREQRETNATRTEGDWASGSLGDFIRRAPREHLLRQLYMFSRSYNIDEAVQRIGRCACVLYTETFTDGVAALNQQLGLALEPRRERTSPSDVEIRDSELDELRELMQPEYDLLEQVAGLACSTPVQDAAVERGSGA